MSYLFMRYPGGKTKAATFSYDDGAKTDLRLAEILNEYGIKCTFNICKIENKSEKLTKKDIEKYLLGTCHEVALHGYAHKAPGNSTDIEIIKDVLSCRENLENELGGIIRGYAYPDCGISNVGDDRYKEIRQILKSLDVTFARTLGKDNNRFLLPDDFYAWMPTCHHDNPEVLSWTKEFVALDVNGQYHGNRFPRLFFLWGHSFEFENNVNWEHLRDICKILAGCEDIWYATNSEIYNYKKAFDSLVFNAKMTEAYNPTLLNVWFCVGDENYCIKPGETIKL